METASLTAKSTAARPGAQAYRGILRAIADSVDGNVEGALDYVLVQHGTQGGSSYAPTEVSDGRELEFGLVPHLQSPKRMSEADAAATLDAMGALDTMRARRAHLIADGFSASLMCAPHSITMTVSRAGELFATHELASSDVDSVSLSLVVRGKGCVAAVTSLGGWEGFHVEEILVPEVLMAIDAGLPAAELPRLIDARARLRYQSQITKAFARFLVLALTAFDGRLKSYLQERDSAPAPLMAEAA
jgi:hypothetical protein